MTGPLPALPARARLRCAMPTLRLVRRYRFCAAHRYYRPEWTEERNHEVFGRCANPHGHGHNYRLELELIYQEQLISILLPVLLQVELMQVEKLLLKQLQE